MSPLKTGALLLIFFIVFGSLANPKAEDDPVNLKPPRHKKLQFKVQAFAESEAANITSRRQKWNELESRLLEIEKSVNEETLPEQPLARFNVIVDAWRSALKVQGQIDQFYLDLPGLQSEVDLLEKEVREADNQDIETQFKQVLKQAKENRKKFEQERIASLQKNQKLAHSIFYLVSQRRAKSLRANLTAGNREILDWSNEYFLDLKREFEAIPFRWVSLFEIRSEMLISDLKGGVSGWLKVLRETAGFFLFIGFFFVGFRFFRSLSNRLNLKREILVRKGLRSRISRDLALVLQKVTPYIPWAGTLILLGLGVEVAKESYFSELLIFVPYFSYYVYYRCFRIAVNQFLTSHAIFGGHLSIFKDKAKILKTSKIVGIYFLLAIALDHTVETTVGEGFIFIWMRSVINWVTVIVLMFSALLWRGEYAALAGKLFSQRWSNITDKIVLGRLGIIFTLPIAIILLTYLLLLSLYRWSERFEIVKSISAEVFRKKVEGLNAKEETPSTEVPADYTEKFMRVPTEIRLSKTQSDVFSKVSTAIDHWKDDTSDEHIVAIVGEKGIGKTTVKEKLIESRTGLNVLDISFADKVKTVEQLEQLLQASLEGQQTVIFIDQCQNLFLSTVGGFEIFKRFLRLTQERSDQVFWCVVFNNYSWIYLQSVLNKSRYFNHVFKMSRWAEEEIKSLILDRHKETGYQMKFDEIVMAAKSERDYESVSYIEAKYFRLLWEETLGNPAVAKSVWIQGIKPYAWKWVKVGLPRDRMENLNGMPDDFYFVLSSIVRHENLTLEEAIDTTGLPADIVVNATKTFVENDYIEFKKSRMSLTYLWQHSVFSTLRRKNFIYE